MERTTSEADIWPRDSELRRGVFRHFQDGAVEFLCIKCEGSAYMHGTIAADLLSTRQADGTIAMRSDFCASCARRRASIAARAKALPRPAAAAAARAAFWLLVACWRRPAGC